MHIQERETLDYAASAKYYTYDYSIETAKSSLLLELGDPLSRRFARGTLSQCLSNSPQQDEGSLVIYNEPFVIPK